MPSPRWLSLLSVSVLAFSACDSKTTLTIDRDLQARFETITDCFPNLYGWVEALLDIADTWRLDDGANPPDPAGLSWSVSGQNLAVDYVVGGTTVSMTIGFYGPSGAQQDASVLIGSATRLSDAIDNAATELRNLFGSGEKFVHGVWSISGGGISASGEGLTGILGGTSNQIELAELRTTAETVAGGIPAVESSTITDSGPPSCTFAFEIPGLSTDEEPGQEYPNGVVTLSVTGQTTVTATITFDKTAVATVVVDDIAGSFAFNLETRTLTYVP